MHSLLTFNKLNLMKVMTCNDNVFLWWGFHLNLTHTFPLFVSFFTFVCAPSVAFLGHVILSVIISLDVNRVWVNEDDQIKID